MIKKQRVRLKVLMLSSDGAAVKSAGGSWSPLQGSRVLGAGLPPLLEEPHALAAAVGAPEVAPARGGMAAVARPMVAVASSLHTGALSNILQQLQISGVFSVIRQVYFNVVVSRVNV